MDQTQNLFSYILPIIYPHYVQADEVDFHHSGINWGPEIISLVKGLSNFQWHFAESLGLVLL